MPRQKKCHNRAHDDRRLRGNRAAKCAACGDRFPCANEACGHLDCGWVRSGEITLEQGVAGA